MKKKYYISASSLTETIVAITIITICCLIGVIAYTTVLNNSPSPQSLDYEYEMDKLIAETIDQKNTVSLVKDLGSFKINKKVIKEGVQGLYQVTFSIQSNRETFEKEIMIYKTEEND